MDLEDEEIIQEDVKRALLQLKKENQSLAEENFVLRHEVDQAEDRVHQLTHDLSQKQMLMKFYHKELESLEGGQSGSRSNNIKSALETLESKARALQHEKWELTVELESRKAELDERSAKLEVLQQTYLKQIESLKSKVSRNEEKFRAQEERNAALQLEKEILLDKLRWSQQDYDQVRCELESKNKQIEEFSSRERSILEEICARQAEIDQLKMLYEDRRDEATRVRTNTRPLNGRPRSYSANESYGRQSSIRDELEDSIRRENGGLPRAGSPGFSPIQRAFDTVRSSNRTHGRYFGRSESLEGFHHHETTISGSPMQIDHVSTYSICGDSGCGDLGSDDESSFGYHSPHSPGLRRRKGWRVPSKLQLVKPLEGSETLHHWRELATPSLASLLEDREGVLSRHEQDAQRPSRSEWISRDRLWSQPEEDDDPEVKRLYNRQMSDPQEIRQSLTDELMQGISGYGVKPQRIQTSEDDQKDPMRPRSNSLVETIKSSGLRARGRRKEAMKNLQEHMASTIAPFLTDCLNSNIPGDSKSPKPETNKNFPRLGTGQGPMQDAVGALNSNALHVLDTKKLPSPMTSNLALGSLITRQLYQLIAGNMEIARDQNHNVTTAPANDDTAKSNISPRLKIQYGAAANPRRRNKLKIKIVKKKKVDNSHPLLQGNGERVSVLNTITSMRSNNLLIGGFPEIPTSPFHESSYIEDIALNLFTSS